MLQILQRAQLDCVLAVSEAVYDESISGHLGALPKPDEEQAVSAEIAASVIGIVGPILRR